MKIHDVSAQHIFPNKLCTTYECIPKVVVTVVAVLIVLLSLSRT